MWVWTQIEVYKRKARTRDGFFARILDSFSHERRKDQLRSKSLRARFTKRFEFHGGIFEHLLWTVTNTSFKN